MDTEPKVASEPAPTTAVGDDSQSMDQRELAMQSATYKDSRDLYRMIIRYVNM